MDSQSPAADSSDPENSGQTWRIPADDGSGEIVEIQPVQISPPIGPPAGYARGGLLTSTSAVAADVERAAADDHQQRETAARAELAKRVQAAIELHLEGDRGVAKGHGPRIAAHAAEAAVDVLTEFLRNPPSFITYPDGTTRIEQR